MPANTIPQDRSPTGLATEVYAHTQPGDKLRALLVDLHVWKGGHLTPPRTNKHSPPPSTSLTSSIPGLGTWILPPHDDANGPMYFRREVRTSMRSAGSAIHDPDVAMPWEVNLCQYHVHADTPVCERKRLLGESQLEQPSAPGMTSASGTPFRCPPCGKPFPSASALSGHKASPGHKKRAKNWTAGAAQ